MSRASRLTKSLEDYMRAIHILTKRKRVVRVKDIARLLKVRPSSVTFALKKLSEMGLVEYEKHGYVDLTNHGLRIASTLSSRYRSIERFLERVLGLPKEVAEEDACSMEHYLHDETVDRIRKFVEFIEENPGKAKLIDDFIDYCKGGKN